MIINTTDDLSRLALLFVEQDKKLALKGKEGYLTALSHLWQYKLQVKISDQSCNTKALQASLLTIINCGSRAFKGGISVYMPKNVPLLVPWPNKKYLNDVILELGGTLKNDEDVSFTLFFGKRANDNNSFEIVANGWQGGVVAAHDEIVLKKDPDGILGGVYAGAIAVALGFLRVSGEKIDATIKSTGISLWRPDLSWLDKSSCGPSITFFPKKLWFVGLGHLGQAYLWTLGLFSYKKKQSLSVYLQDTDRIQRANTDTGLLSYVGDINVQKTRVCSQWLEERDINTFIIERLFNENTIPTSDEPDILICGFDSAKSRRELDLSKFKNILDCGLGANKSSFDSISFHNLGVESKNGNEIWHHETENDENSASKELISNMLPCGTYDIGIGASFVGAISSVFVISEILRAYHKGMVIDKFRIWIRSFTGKLQINSKNEEYQNSNNYSRHGFIELN